MDENKIIQQFEGWLVKDELSGASKRCYINDVRKLLEHFTSTGTDIRTLTATDIATYFNQKKYTLATVKRKLSSIGLLAKHLNSEYQIQFNLGAEQKKEVRCILNLKETPKLVIDEAQFERAIEAMNSFIIGKYSSSNRNIEYATAKSVVLASLFYRLGASTSALRQLDEKDFSVKESAGNLEAIITLSGISSCYEVKNPTEANRLANYKTVLKQYKSFKGTQDIEPALFVNKKGFRLSEKHLRTALKRMLPSEEIPIINSRILRRSSKKAPILSTRN